MSKGRATNKLGRYYTAKVLESDPILKVAMLKWAEGDDIPSDTYVVIPGNGWSTHACNCAAYSICKHQRAVREAITDGKINELWKWRWLEKKTSEGIRLIPEESDEFSTDWSV